MVTRPRVLCLVLLSWLVSVVSSFAQFIVRNAQDRWGTSDGTNTIELGLGRPQGGNYSTPFPPAPPKLPFPQDHSVIGSYLPYGGFLSKFLITYTQNFTYAEIHSSHWGVCAADTVLSPGFMVYVYGATVFLVPLLVMLSVYLDLMCVAPRRLDPGPDEALGKSMMAHSRSVALSLSLLVLLCLPMHVTYVVQLFAPGRRQPYWATLLVSLLFQSYGLVPPLLFREKQGEEGTGGVPSSVAPAGVASVPSPRQKAMGWALCVTLQECSSCCPHSPGLKDKVCSEV